MFVFCSSHPHHKEKYSAKAVQVEMVGKNDCEVVVLRNIGLSTSIPRYGSQPVGIHSNVWSHSHQVSQLPHHIIPETSNFSRPCDSQHGAMAFFEVPLMVAVITLSIPILPLIQYCVGTAILSYYTNTMMCEGTFNLLAVLEWSQLQVYCTCT